MKTTIPSVLRAAVLGTLLTGSLAAQSTIFNYQGALNDNGAPANGTYDFEFQLFDALTGGSEQGVAVTLSSIEVSNGLFSVSLDFGDGAWSGDDRWLEMGVKDSGAPEDFEPQARTPIFSVPYAVRARQAATADTLPSGTTLNLSNLSVTWGGNTPQLTIEQTSAGNFARLQLATPNGSWNMSAQDSATGDLRFFNGTTDRMVLDDNGDLAIDGGLFLGGTSESLKWDATEERFEVSDALSVNGGIQAKSATSIASGGNTPQLTVEQTSAGNFARLKFATPSGSWNISAQDAAQGDLRFYNGSTDRMILDDNGKLVVDGGIDSQAASSIASSGNTPQLRVEQTSAGNFARLELATPSGSWNISAQDSETGDLRFFNGTTNRMVLKDNGDLQIDGELDSNRVKTGVLEITGGADLSEKFEISNTVDDQLPEPGMIVCIDPTNPGHLVPSSSAHDRTVAGIISGAGGVRPGMLMGQHDSLADGAHPVALTGRVYCYVDASHGPIEPGDLITTSDTPGHGMAVRNHDLARCAIIGKAMTGLKDGAGLVLVLVSLQ